MTAQFLLNFSRTFSTKTPRKDVPEKTSRRRGNILFFFSNEKTPCSLFLSGATSHFRRVSGFPPAGLCIENNRGSRLTGAPTCPAPDISAVLATPSPRFASTSSSSRTRQQLPPSCVGKSLTTGARSGVVGGRSTASSASVLH